MYILPRLFQLNTNLKMRKVILFLFISAVFIQMCYSQHKKDTINIIVEDQIIVPMCINGVKTYGMIDTGSNISFVDVTKLKLFKMKKSFLVNMEVNSLSGRSNDIYQVLRYDIKIGKTNLYGPLAIDLTHLTNYVYSKYKIEISAIIGLSYLNLHHVIVDLNKKILIVECINYNNFNN